MGLQGRAYGLWLDGDDNPYETLSAQLAEEKIRREIADVADAEESTAEAEIHNLEFERTSYAACENENCPTAGTPQWVTIELTEFAPVTDFQAGRWTCESCATVNYWANS